jgi:hypothetical protein
MATQRRSYAAYVPLINFARLCLYRLLNVHAILPRQVILLIRKGASVHKVDAGQTALHRCLSWADMSQLSDIEPIVRLLIAAGANKDARDEDNKTPREYCAAALLEKGLEVAFAESRTFEEVDISSRVS